LKGIPVYIEAVSEDSRDFWIQLETLLTVSFQNGIPRPARKPGSRTPRIQKPQGPSTHSPPRPGSDLISKQTSVASTSLAQKGKHNKVRQGPVG